MYKTSRLFDALFLIILAVALWQAYVARVALSDWLYFMSYKPAPEIVALANKVEFTSEGRRLFYRGDPEIITDASERNAVCGQEEIGCLTGKGRIIIYDPTGDTNEEVVTAAHETLHLAYRRYDATTRLSVDDLVSSELSQLSYNTALRTELSGYSGDNRLDEAHSYMGTEYAPLPPDLETHYSEYFRQRSVIVAAYVSSQN